MILGPSNFVLGGGAQLTPFTPSEVKGIAVYNEGNMVIIAQQIKMA